MIPFRVTDHFYESRPEDGEVRAFVVHGSYGVEAVVALDRGDIVSRGLKHLRVLPDARVAPPAAKVTRRG